MKIKFLGTNGWYDNSMGNTICTLIDCDDCYVILDAGDGIHKIRELIIEKKPIYVFLSHLHLDHISGFHILQTMLRKEEIHIILEKGNEAELRSIVRRPFMIPFGENVIFHEVAEGKYEIPLSFECLNLKHADPSMGYRLYLEDKVIAYCLDTGICDNVIKLSQDADILITESSMLTGTSNQEWGHLNPQEAAELAKKAGAKKLILTHLSTKYRNAEEKDKAEEGSRKIFANSVIAKDDLVINL